MKRYETLNSIHKFLQRARISYEHQKAMQNQGYDLENEYILFKKEGIGHISIMMTDKGIYELVSYNNRTDIYKRVNGHTEEFIDRIMQGQTGV